MKILGLGDNVVDKFLDRGIMYPGGQAMNVCIFCNELGNESAYMGFFGTDDKAALNQKILKMKNIDFSHSRIIEGENAFAYVMTIDGERVFLGSNKGGIAKDRDWDFSKQDTDYITSFDLVFTDQNSNTEDELMYLKEKGSRIVFDFSKKFDSAYLERCAPYLFIAFISVGENEQESKIIAKMREIAGFGVPLVVATRGKNGALALYDNYVYRQDAIPTNVKDTMGAGDAFESGFLSSLMKNTISAKSIQEALRDGAVIAAKTCATEGSYGYGEPFILTEYEKELIIDQLK